jgi:hypothetical protein
VHLLRFLALDRANKRRALGPFYLAATFPRSLFHVAPLFLWRKTRVRVLLPATFTAWWPILKIQSYNPGDLATALRYAYRGDDCRLQRNKQGIKGEINKEFTDRLRHFAAARGWMFYAT